MRHSPICNRLSPLFLLPFLLQHVVNPALANFVAWNASSLTTIRSPFANNITVSYKVPDNGTCTTAFDTQKQYTGWVNVPGDYPTNLFFWFVEARQQPANLTIWFNGGPGFSSLLGFFVENGPCEVIEVGLGKYETVAREWGWDRASNMLFIDQPNQVGFSYDTPTDGSIDFLQAQQYEPAQSQLNTSLPPYTWANGTFSTNSPNNTANTTQTAAMAVWHMLQGFMGAFPQYRPEDNGSMSVNLFAESYGGLYAPIFADVWEQQNEDRLTGEVPASATVDIRLDSVGIINGCVDEEISMEFYPFFAVNNSYGFQWTTYDEINNMTSNFGGLAGCVAAISACRTAQSTYDPSYHGNVTQVNSACFQAYQECITVEIALISMTGRSPYDIAHPSADPFPPMTFLDYVNTPQFQAAISSPINFTESSETVFLGFAETGDELRVGAIDALARLLNKGIRVGFIYGDRDYICNWYGGQAVSLAVAASAGNVYATGFPAAGYQPIIVNDTYVGGAVRQFGNLSFSRVYQSGHSVPAYQPETAFQIFTRIIMGTAVPDGHQVDLSTYNTTGPANATATGTLPGFPSPTCYIRSIQSTCSESSIQSIKEGKGVVINGVWYAESSDWPLATGNDNQAAGLMK